MSYDHEKKEALERIAVALEANNELCRALLEQGEEHIDLLKRIDARDRDED